MTDKETVIVAQLKLLEKLTSNNEVKELTKILVAYISDKKEDQIGFTGGKNE